MLRVQNNHVDPTYNYQAITDSPCCRIALKFLCNQLKDLSGVAFLTSLVNILLFVDYKVTFKPGALC